MFGRKYRAFYIKIVWFVIIIQRNVDFLNIIDDRNELDGDWTPADWCIL